MIKDNKFNVILANITRNILLADMKIFGTCVVEGGNLLVSGFFNEDYPMVREEAEKNGFIATDHITEDNWAGALFTKK